MVFGCGNKCVKFMVFFVNFLICVAGGILFGISLWANLDKDFQGHLNHLVKNENLNINVGAYTAGIWVLVGIGAFLFLTGFLGCCGAACENKCLLGIFFTIVLICFLIELAAGIAAFVLKDKFKTDLKNELQKLLNKGEQEAQQALKAIQDDFNCCGVNGPIDYSSTNNCPATATQGCFNVLWNLIEKNAIIAGAIAIGILVIELLAMIFSCVLCSAIGAGGGKYNYA